MIRLAHQEYLYALGLIPVFIILFLFMRVWRKKLLARFGEKELVKKLSPDVSNTKPWLKFILIALTFGLIILGIAGPQMGTKLEEVKREGVDIIIALDVSNSMLAQDIRPDRLERSKQAIARVIEKLQNDRIGIIVFAGRAYVQLPLTSDFGAAKLFLSTINTDIIPTQGTAVGAAIDLAIKSFGNNIKKHKALVIITDGENHEDDAVKAAKAAADEGIIIHTIGMGSMSGGPIPTYKNKVQTGFLKDNNGNTVVTKLDEGILREIAETGKGKFVRASNSEDGMGVVLGEISRMEKKNFGTKMYTDYEHRYQYFLALALLLLLIEFVVGERRSKWFQSILNTK
ncbi:MAG TPA: VWA domain-containing protein [Cytophagaceae bacterium]|jgi:Ca-activated chloride channel family protein